MCRRSVGSRERVVENGILVDGRLHRIAWTGEDGGWRSGVSRMFLCFLFFPLFGMISSQTWEVFISLPVRKRELGRQSFTIRISLRFDVCRMCSLIVNRRLFISHTSDH